mgnify:CR=1 FL=1
MTKSRAVADYIEKELPYQLLMRLNDNSRLSLRKLGRELNISYHVIAAKLKELEEKYKLFYTLDIDTDKLGFAEGRLITIKFEKMPEIDFIKGLFAKDIFVQDAYLAQGDFDLVMYVVGLTQRDFQKWQFNLRIKLSAYGPFVKYSTINSMPTGLLHIRNELIEKSQVLSPTEKRILCLLNQNSRMRLSELVKAAHTTQMKAIYIIKKLKNIGIIKRFSVLAQETDKKVLSAYGALIFPSESHNKLALEFQKELISEDLHEATNDYDLIVNTNGTYDIFFICSFKDGDIFAKRGPSMLQKLWAEERPKIDQAILTACEVGKWPFILNHYKWAEEKVKEISREQPVD